MNWRWFAGRVPSAFISTVLSHPRFPLFRLFGFRLRWEYDVSRFAETRDFRVIFDVGANIGQTALELSPFFPRATIHSFEPVESTYQILVEKTRHLSGIQTHQLALGHKPADVDIVLQETSDWNSLAFASPNPTGATTRVQVTTIDGFCADHAIECIDVLKTDAQGCDLEVLQGAEGLIASRRIPFVYCEVGFQPGDVTNTPFRKIDDFLVDRGYQLCGFYEQNNYGDRFRLLGCANALYFHPEALRLRFGASSSTAA